MYSRSLLEGAPAFNALQASMSKLAHKVMQKEASRWRKMLRGGKLSQTSVDALTSTNKAVSQTPTLHSRLQTFKNLKSTGTAPKDAARQASKPTQQPFKPILDFGRESRGLSRGNKLLMQRHKIKPIKPEPNPYPQLGKRINKPSYAHAVPKDRTLTLGHTRATPASVRRTNVTNINRAHNMAAYGNPFGRQHRFPLVRPDLLTRFYRNPKTGFNRGTGRLPAETAGEMGKRFDFRTPSQKVIQRGAKYVDDALNRWAVGVQRAVRPARNAWADLMTRLRFSRNKGTTAARGPAVDPASRFSEASRVAGPESAVMPKPARAGDVAGTARHEIDEVIRGKAIGPDAQVNYFSHMDPSILQREAGHLNFMHPAAQEKTLRMRARTGELQQFADTVAGRPSTGVRPDPAVIKNMSAQELRQLAQPFLQSHKLSPSARKRLTRKLQDNYDKHWKAKKESGEYWGDWE